MDTTYTLQQKNNLYVTTALKKVMVLFILIFLSVPLLSQIRKNLNDLSPASRTQLVNLMQEYITKDVIENHCSSLSDGHTMDIHDDLNFLGFHRCYIEAMEDFLLKKGYPQYVPLPAWPPNTPIPTEFRVVDADCQSAVCNIGVTGNPVTDCKTPTNWNPSISRPGYLSLPIKSGATDDLCDFPMASSANDQGSISRILEGESPNSANSSYHNSVHSTMSGAMGRFTSPALPIFWCFHAYVDDIWKEYQCSCPNKGGKALDLYMKDSPRVTAITRDGGVEPNADTGPMNVSTDIWVRNQNDGKSNYTNQNPVYSKPNYVYVRVRNRGCQASPGNEQLMLHWSKGATAQTWPTYWNESITSPALMGDTISVVTIPSIVAGSSVILEIQWFPPNGASYSSNATPKLFSLLARIVSANDPMATAEGSTVFTNVRNNNNIVMKDVTVETPPNIFPVVNILKPVENTQFIAPASIAIQANASDEDGSISKVEFYNGATLIGTASASPYTINWNGVTADSYTLTAKAFDNSNATSTSSEIHITVKTNTLPVVSISSPIDGSTYIDPANISITANASDADGSISKVEFYNGTILLGTATTTPYTYNWINVPVGVYAITAKAYDDLNAVKTSTVVNVTVNNNNLPLVNISAPVNGTILIAPATTVIKANATDSDGSISKVEFYSGSTLLGTVTSSPYTYTLNALPAGVYSLTAKAYDDLNASKTSTVVTLTVNNNSLPTVVITAPSSGSKLIAPASTTINVNANDSDGSISKVEFYNGSILLGEDGSSPYSFDWNNVPVGTYKLTAKAIDDLNAFKFSDTVFVLVNNNSAPTVQITTPLDGSALIAPASVTIKATATDPDGSISKVEFYNGATLLATSTISPYTYNWNNVPVGTYTLTAKAIDDLNAVTTSSSVTIHVTENSLPTVNITSPVNGTTAIAPATIIIKANAADVDGSISKVEFYEGTTLLTSVTSGPYAFNWNNVPTGTYTLTAKAVDDQGAVKTSSPVTITVNNNNLPLVSLISPDNNTTVTAPANFILKANASDSDGSIAKVEFYEGSSLIGTVTSSPYTYNWNAVPTGSYTLSAKAYDDLNAVKTSASINVIVKDNVLPTVSITHPVTGATAIAPASFVIKANASDSDGSISKVEFYNGTTLLGTSSTSPYAYNWNNITAGTYTLTAIAYDDHNASTTSNDVKVTISNNSLPTVAITSPADGTTAIAPANFNLKANAFDSDGTISKVEFYNGTSLLGKDTTSPFTFDWANVNAGTYTLTAKAYDDLDAVTTSSVVNVTVTFNGLPVVQLTEPANNASFIAPATISIKANASDSDGSISKVEFYNGTVLIGTDNSSPYSIDWSNVGAGSYTLTAKATDNLNAVTASSDVKITVTGNVFPVAEIIYPSNNETFVLPSNITIEADAKDSDGTISKVEFYEGTTLLGSDVTSPYTFDWSPSAVGTYTLTIKATDNLSAVITSSPVKIIVESNSLPLVGITSPVNGSVKLPGLVSIQADASDVDGTIHKIEFYNGTTLLGTDSIHPYNYDWINVPVGNYSIIAKAFDNLNAFSFSDTVRFKVADNNAPTVAIFEPVNNTTLTAPVNTVIKVNAGDSDGSISKVEFYNDLALLGTDVTSPFSFTWNTAVIGTHSLTAKAFDDRGMSTTSAPVSVIVKENEVPVVTITSPANGATAVAPAKFILKATATDSDGNISKVEFYNGTTLLGKDSISPFTFDWNGVPTGTYTLTAKAYDDLNAFTASAAVTVTVNANGLPTVAIISPVTGTTCISQVKTPIKTNATDSDGSISKVEFYNGSTLLGTVTTSPFTFDWIPALPGTYDLTAKAFDDLNAVSTSAIVTVTVVDNTAPTVAILSPANAANFISPANVLIKANATDKEGSISKVEFYNGSTFLGTDTIGPYTFDWNAVTAGTYTLTAKAVDNLNASTVSSSIVITVKDNLLPSVSITSPTDGATGISPAFLTLKANATDGDGSISKVEFYNGSTLLGTSTTSPYTFDWNNVIPGVYILTAKAYDDLNAVTVSAPVKVTIKSNSLPSVVITEPLNGTTALSPASFIIKANASDTDGSISQVEFYKNGILISTDLTSPYTQDLNALPAGVYTLTAKAYDDLNAATTSLDVKVTVKDNTAPSVAITAPSNGASAIAPANLTIKATASDTDGDISKVEFYNGAILLGTVTTSPYTYAWNGVTAGVYILTAKAYDNLNASTVSAEVKVTVDNNIFPTVSIIAPANGAVVTTPATITLKANATDADGNISKVEFYNGSTLITTVASAPYIFNWNVVPTGTYLLTAKAYDDLNAAAVSSEVKITVVKNSLPTVTISAPVTQSIFLAPTAITIKANASDSDGSISKVEFYQGTTLLGSDASSPYSYDWNNVPVGDYTLTVKAYDDLNESSTSDNIKIAVVNNLLPTVTITSPLNDAMFMPASTITITAAANDANGSISKVEFYENGTLIGTATTSPYSYNWPNVPIGDYKLTAKAYDNVNAFSISDTVKIMVEENMKPMVLITRPYPNEYFNVPANITILAHALDHDGMVDKVEFYQGTTLLGTDHMSPYEFSWNNVPPGNYDLTAVAYDDMGESDTSTIVPIIVDSNILPVAKITNPVNGDVFAVPGPILISADASDASGSVKWVDFYFGNTWIGSDSISPYEVTWNNVQAGSYTLSAKVHDDQNAINYSEEVLISVVNNTAPVVTIASPADGAHYISGTDIPISATAQDDGSIQRVEFYRGNVLILSDSIAPYNCIWKNAGEGSYTLTAKAYDNLGIYTVSAKINIRVANNLPPAVLIISPLNNAVLTGPTDVLITATAQDSDGSIAYVDFYNGTSYIGSDSSSTYSFNWKNVPFGIYDITAKAYDNLNAAGVSSVVTIKIEANQLPIVTLTSPSNGASYTTPADITLEADAQDANGTIARVDFYHGNALIGSDSTHPYSYTWKNVGEGVYMLSAKAYDNLNGTNTSGEVKVTVVDIPTGIAEPEAALTDLVLYPVPFDTKLTLDFLASQGGLAYLKIYNETGKEIFSSKKNISSGHQVQDIDTGNWPNGIYFLTLQLNEHLLKKKLLKMGLN